MAKATKDDMADILAACDDIEKTKGKKKASKSDDEITDKDIEDLLDMLEDSGDNDSEDDNTLRRSRCHSRRKEENYFTKHSFLSIVSGFVLIVAIGVNINPDLDLLNRIGVIIGALVAIWWIMWGNRCPNCKEPHAMKVISKTPIHSSATYSKKDDRGNYHTYHRVTERITKQCKHCSHKTVSQREREEQLN